MGGAHWGGGILGLNFSVLRYLDVGSANANFPKKTPTTIVLRSSEI